jgi:hypothetical protein
VLVGQPLVVGQLYDQAVPRQEGGGERVEPHDILLDRPGLDRHGAGVWVVGLPPAFAEVRGNARGHRADIDSHEHLMEAPWRGQDPVTDDDTRYVSCCRDPEGRQHPAVTYSSRRAAERAAHRGEGPIPALLARVPSFPAY